MDGRRHSGVSLRYHVTDSICKHMKDMARSAHEQNVSVHTMPSSDAPICNLQSISFVTALPTVPFLVIVSCQDELLWSMAARKRVYGSSEHWYTLPKRGETCVYRRHGNLDQDAIMLLGPTRCGSLADPTEHTGLDPKRL